MNKTQEEFTKAVYETIKDKVFFSNISKEIADVVEKLPEEIVPGKVLFDGMMLFDGIEGIEDDIQQMCSYTKDVCIVNLEDYYTDSGAFDDDGWDRFMAALGRLMTADEFSQYLDKNGNGLDFPYPIDENGHAEIPAGTLYIKDEAFMNCSKLVSVTMPDTVLEIRDRAFCGCNNLASIELPAYVRLIAPSAFNGCTSLASVVFSTVGALLIEEHAFAGCTSLTNVEFKTPPTVIVRHAFEGCPCEEEVMRKSDY
jgi:hypothetical protein